MTVALALILGIFLMSPGLTFAGVGGADVPTVTSPVTVGQTGLSWSFTITNLSTTPNDVDNVQVLSPNNIFFTTTCGIASPDGICPAGSREAPNTITISPLTGTGLAGTACAGVSFTVAATANPNEYVFTPGANVILGPSSAGGNAARCQVNFTVNINAAPVHDSSSVLPGLQTSQLARVETLQDTTTLETGSCAGTSTVLMSATPTISTTPNPTSGPIGTVLNDSATLSGGVSPTGTITFNLFGVNDQTCSGAPIFTNTVPVSGNGTYSTSAGFTTVVAGTYHWMATYSGDASNASVSSICADEAVVIGKIQPTISTTPNPTSGPIGTVLNDSATLAGGSGLNGGPTGTITFKLFGVNDQTCSGAPIFTNTVPVSGNGTYSTSAGFTTVAAGTYHWIATYSGDANNDSVSSICANEAVVIRAPLTISTTPNPTSGPVGTVLNDCAALSGGVNPTGTIAFKLFGVNDQTCSGAPIFTNTVPVSGSGTYCTSAGFTTVEAGTYHWIATYSGDANNDSVSDLCANEAVVIGKTSPPSSGEDPYIAVVGNDIGANAFYLSPKHEQFLYDQTGIDVPVTGEAFTTNAPLIEPEICDTLGIATVVNDIPGPPFTFRGNFNGRITAGNQGYYQWSIRLPKKPSGEINLCFQCGVLKPDAFKFWDFSAVLACAAETGERIGTGGLCVREEVDPGVNPVISAALPVITAVASPGPHAPVGFVPFNLTAFRNPGTYNLALFDSGAAVVNDAATQVLNGTTDTRILLKACMDKCVLVKLPVTGQVNALGQLEQDLEAGDLITVRMNIPRANTVDVYCHKESLRVMGVGEGMF